VMAINWVLMFLVMNAGCHDNRAVGLYTRPHDSEDSLIESSRAAAPEGALRTGIAIARPNRAFEPKHRLCW
jgi:hypothetical protein